MPDKAQDDDLVMKLVDMALARPSEEREAYLQSACSGNSDLYGQVWNYIQWEDKMKGFLLDPLYPLPLYEHPFEPGDLLDGRFRIVREVAQGGMGIVYEATDEKLGRRIALKCAKAGFRKRLPPEVRLATEISHPDVCKTYEIHSTSSRQGDIDFLTMEFLDGETLFERLRRGPIPDQEARLIALQLCAGLAEAHRNNVIHGDLKSGNVILAKTPGGGVRAVITDFGLARGSDAPQRTEQSGERGGTPNYMAPELLRGEKASAASDIFALGVMLYELASGRRPFEREETGPAPAREEMFSPKPPAVHPKWDRVLARCLDPDPVRRFRGADEIAQALTPSPTRRVVLKATAAAALLAAASVAVTYIGVTAPAESVRLAVLPFESGPDTAAVSRDILRQTMDQMARLKGSARTRFSLIPLAQIQNHKVDRVERARPELAATHVLHGTLGNEKGKIMVHVYLTDARSLVNAKEWKADYAPGDVRYVPVALAGLVTGTLRLRPLLAGATVSPTARNDYLAGLSFARRDSGVDEALACLERAAAADPGSPLTHAGLAEAQWFKYFLTRDPAYLERAAESVRQAELRNSDLAEVHRIAGSLRANSGWYEQAAAEYRRAIELDPSNSDAYRRLGAAYEANNQLDEALAEYRRAVEKEPVYYRNYQALGAFYDQQAKYKEAAEYFRKAVELAPAEPNLRRVMGAAYKNLGMFVEAENELRFSLSLGETPTALHTLGVILMYQAKDQEAIPYISRALNRWPERPLWWVNLGIAYRRLNLTAESELANRRGLELAEAELRMNPRSGYVRSYLAYLCARLGDHGRAESEIAQALQLSPQDVDTRWFAAKTYEALGRREDTLAVLDASPESVLVEASRYPDLADLQKDSRFLQMLASRRIK